MLNVTYLQHAYPPSTAYGGPAISGHALCRALVERGVQVRVLAVAADGARDLDVPLDRWTEHEGVSVYYGRRIGRTQVAPIMYVGARRAFEADVLHVSGGFSATFPVMALRARAARMPIIMSPRGSFLPQALAHHARRKRLFNRLLTPIYDRLAMFHATSSDEAAAIREVVPGARTVVIPNGVAVPTSLDVPPPVAKTSPYLLFLGRIHPHKQLDAVITAFARSGLSDFDLWIAGDGDAGHRSELERHASAAGVGDRVKLLGHVVGPEKAAMLMHAEALVLASRSENFGMSVAEALAHGTPCLVTKTAPWPDLEPRGAGLWVDDDADALTEGMVRLLAPGVDRKSMGKAGRSWMQREYGWDRIAERMIEAYRQMLEAANTRETAAPHLADR